MSLVAAGLMFSLVVVVAVAAGCVCVSAGLRGKEREEIAYRLLSGRLSASVFELGVSRVYLPIEW
ncbi:hypothetical protein EJ04DRAFT_513697 [Polyplosphaeria fusca]|uniref:NADH dehydrogenase subunit 1 n=1 Tax=Polyplosphaeria fusca TaxID=682080 RepID=A0A9P4UZR5_9PLEO|nr:hypothetical protein EJ04DRAFT_513697 [Polyplosphaeria fusca]